VMYGNLASANIKLADEGCNLGSNRNLIVNNTLVSATGLAGVRNVQGLGNTIFNNVIVTTGYKCVLDDTASNCSNGGEGSYYLAGLEKTPTQAATGIFVSYSGNNFALTSGSPAIGAGVASFNGWLAAPVDILGNVRPYGGGYDAGGLPVQQHLSRNRHHATQHAGNSHHVGHHALCCALDLDCLYRQRAGPVVLGLSQRDSDRICRLGNPR